MDIHDYDLFGGKQIYVQNIEAYPSPPGSHNSKRKCLHCAYYCRVNHHNKIYLKCGVIKHRWTYGAGTDIKAKSPACSYFTSNE